MKKRYLERHIKDDLGKKMVFIGGPRRVGKTTLSLDMAEKFYKSHEYLNWDHVEDRKKIVNLTFKGDAELLILDEVHKFKRWKNHIKGLYDKEKDRVKILVTGSARLDVYRKGGDSLVGRYYHYRLHPFSLAEFLGRENKIIPFMEFELPKTGREETEAFNILLKFGGFPEPLLAQNEKEHRRWHYQRMDTLVREEIRDLELIKDISLIQILVDLLPDKVSSRLSINSLREDLEVSHKAVSKWLEILERFYYCFRVYPFTHSRIKALKKEPKLYLWDWSTVNDPGAGLENLVASHLLKLCHYLNDAEGYKTELYYLRDIEGREVDFIVTENKKPWFAVEVKSSDKKTSEALLYYGRKLNIAHLFQVVNERDIDIRKDRVRILSVEKFLISLI